MRIRKNKKMKAEDDADFEEIDFELTPDEDPMSRFGFGIQNYFDIIWCLIKAMILLSVINIPIYIINGSY